jgi:hypothetical protein
MVNSSQELLILLSQIIVSNESGTLSFVISNPSQSNISISLSPHLYLLSAKIEKKEIKRYSNSK